jgi:sugar O-acyltransferase (sialic acid O-acetyltransferase NeuD family)
MKDLILIGGGGHCKSVIDVIEMQGYYKIVGILDKPDLVGTIVLGYPIVGTDSDILKFKNQNCEFLITIGQIRAADSRIKIYSFLKSIDAKIAKVISPLANISKHSLVKDGTIVMHHANINASSTIGVNGIINTNAIIEHDVKIGDHCHISTGTIINGNCKIANNCFIGSNSVLMEGINVEENCTIGMGSVVNKSIIGKNNIIFGNPAKKKK